MLKHCAIRVFLLLTCLTLSSFVGLCAPPPAMFGTVVDTANNQVPINGSGFSPSGLAAKVTFANTALTIVHLNNTKTVVKLANRFVAETYSLQFANSNNQQQRVQQPSKRSDLKESVVLKAYPVLKEYQVLKVYKAPRYERSCGSTGYRFRWTHMPFRHPIFHSSIPVAVQLKA